MKANWLIIFALFAGALHGEPVVKVRGIAGLAEKPVALQVFSERPLELLLEFSAAGPEESANFQAKLYQLATSIAAPLGPELPVAQELLFDHSLVRSQTWRFTPPAVKRVTRFELRFAWQKKDAPEWHPAGSVRLTVYPDNIGAELKKLIQTGEEQGLGKIAVFGASELLKSALNSVAVPFGECGEHLPNELDAGTVYLGEGRPEELEALSRRPESRGRVILFVSDSTVLPGVYWTDYPSGFMAKVSLPLLTDFSQSPYGQMGLLNLLNRAFRAPAHNP